MFNTQRECRLKTEYSVKKREEEKGQERKGKGRMPRYQEPKKDVESCAKPRGAAHKHRAVDIRMGKPTYEKRKYLYMNK